jgi:hypothetical protein
MRSTLLIIALATAAAAVGADLDMRPGRWELATQVVQPGAGGEPAADLGPMLTVHCMTADDAKHLGHPDWLLPGATCAITSRDQSAERLSFVAQCTDDGIEITIDFRMTMHSREHWSGSATARAGGAQLFDMTFDGKHTGAACPQGE